MLTLGVHAQGFVINLGTRIDASLSPLSYHVYEFQDYPTVSATA